MKTRHWSVALAAVSLAFVAFAAARRDSLSTVLGDESTYLAMAESLAGDGDLWFTADDAERLSPYAGTPRGTVILQTVGHRVAYSKPILYPVLAAPVVALAGDGGLFLFNALALALAAFLAWRFLRRLGDGEAAMLTVVTFVGASALLAQVGWRMSDLLLACLALGGLALVLEPLRGAATWRGSAWIGGAALGLLVSTRLPNLLVLLAALAALWLAGRRRRAVHVAVAAALALLAVGAAGRWAAGTSSPYRAVRSSFDGSEGYPVDPQAASYQYFFTRDSTQQMTWKPDWKPRVTAYSALYFFIGRHSGVLWYFPAAVALLLTALRRPDRATLALLGGMAALVGFYLVWWPDNYFGGSAFLGNRYFLSAYPLLLVALPRLPGKGLLALSWGLAAIVGGSVALALAAPPLPGWGSQSHVAAGLLRRLPYESTARAIDGRRDRYWAGDLVRFVDPIAAVGPDGFSLRVGEAPAELLLVTSVGDPSTLLRYRTRGRGLDLLVSDRRGERRYPLNGGGDVRRGTLAVELAAAWRRHPYWWAPDTVYAARSVRLAVVPAAGAPAEPAADAGHVALWYGGPPSLVERGFRYGGPAPRLPVTATAGATTEVALRLRNTSPVPWHRGGALPVRLAYRLAPLGGGPVVEGERVDLPADVPSGDPVDLTLPIEWPEVAGRYRLDVDLVIDDYAWFADRLGHPIASAETTVR